MKKTIQGFIAFLLILLVLLPSTAFAEEDTGIIDADSLNAWMDDYASQYGLNDGYRVFSVGFCYTGTGDSWYYNADSFMYSASLYKVPVCMLAAEKEAAGELTQDSTVMGTTLQYLESTALTYSNNTSGHALVDYLGGTYAGKCSDQTIRFTNLTEDYFEQDFFDYSYYTARYMTQVMKTLYDGGEEAFPHVIEYLLPAAPGEYYRKSLGQLEIAQKYGSYEEMNGNKNEHCAAIIYTPTPVIVTVMTRNVGAYQDRISEVGAYLAQYALELDEHLQAYLAAVAETPEPGSDDLQMLSTDPQEAEASGDLSVQQTETETEPLPVPAAEDSAAPAFLRSGFSRWLLAIPAAVILVILLLAVRRRPKRQTSQKNTPGYRPRH